MKQPPSIRLAEKVSGVLRRVLPLPLLRLAYRCGHATLSVWWLITRPSSHGSKIVVTRGDEVLLVRLTYGARRTWDLPGGMSTETESSQQTAERELYEELGLGGRLEPLGSWNWSSRGRSGELHGFWVEAEPGCEPVIDGAEVAEAGWFSRHELPDRIGRVSMLMIEAALDAARPATA